MALHDNSWLAWLIVLSYTVAAAASLAAGLCSPSGDERRFWMGMACAMLLLALNKQLDLQTTLTQVVRTAAREHNWYAQRRTLQLWFLGMLGVFAVIGTAALAKHIRFMTGAVKGAAVGVVLLVLFVLSRAASFHHLDEWFRAGVAGFRRSRALELIGIYVVIGSAVAAFVRQRNSDCAKSQ